MTNPHQNREYIPKKDRKEYWDELTKPVVCESMTDIQMAIKPFMEDRGSESVNISCEIDGDKVSGVSSSASYRKILLDGLEVIKKRIKAVSAMREALDKSEEGEKNNMKVWEVDKLRFNVDTLIERKLGGKRVGIRIRWELKDGIYEYDPFGNKLFEIENESN